MQLELNQNLAYVNRLAHFDEVMKFVLSKICYAAIFLTAAVSVQAQVTSVDWGGDYVSGNETFGQGTFGTYRFNDDNAADPTVPVTDTRQRVLFGLTNSTSGYFRPNSGYTAPAGKTGNFYMGTALQFPGGAADPNVFRVSNNTGGNTTDTIRLRAQDNAVSTFALLGFGKTEFLNGTSASARGLDATTSITVTIGQDFGNPGTPTYRYAVLDGSQWYLSNTTFSPSGAGTFTLSSTGTETWGLFNPLGTGAGSTLPGTGIKVAPGAFASQTFNDVQGFGMWASGGFDMDVAGFSATTIPEPSTYAMLAFGLAAVFFLRRRCTA